MKQVTLLLIAALMIIGTASAKDRKRKSRKKYQHEHCSAAPACTPEPAYNYVPKSMSEADFRDACSSIRAAKFDDDRMNIATFIVNKNYLTAEQISAIAGMFSFDDSRLAFAKKAYTACIDQHNYYKLNDVLTFSSSKEALMDYISKK